MDVTLAKIPDLVFKRTGGTRLKLDLYYPRGVPEPFPLVIWILGGEWREKGREATGSLVGWLTEHGFAVAGIEYRTSEQAAFPAQIQDCTAAVRWLRAHAGKYDLDPNRLGVWGDAAGGQLAMLVGSASDIGAFNEGKVEPKISSQVKAVCSFYGPADLGDLPAMQDAVTDLLGAPPEVRPDLAKAASPLTYVSDDSPPHLLIHGTADQIIPFSHSVRLHDALKAHGVPVALIPVEVVGQESDAFYRNPQIRQAVAEFFGHYL